MKVLLRRYAKLGFAGCVFLAISIHSIVYNRNKAIVAQAELVSMTSDTRESAISEDLSESGNTLKTRSDSSGGDYASAESSGLALAESLDDPADVWNNFYSVVTQGSALLSEIQASALEISKREVAPVDQYFGQEVGASIESSPKNPNTSMTLDDGSRPSFHSLRPAPRPEMTAEVRTRERDLLLREQTEIDAPAVSKRPEARPGNTVAASARTQYSETFEHTDLVTAAVAQFLSDTSLEEREETETAELAGTEPASDDGKHLGTILGIFETSIHRWALVEDDLGRMTILETGDGVGSATVTAINDGAIFFSFGGISRQYHVGDRL